ncbi:MAG: metal ABC transporter ATP-binding protein [Planctomycetes bacterium]|nr:metal ABC transporter ATP-binding protein [Planctomycetota bacterium]
MSKEGGKNGAGTVVRARDVSFSYGDVPVLEGVSFDIRKGDYVSILGPNGGGKTTLLKLITGLLKPDSGALEVFGQRPGKTGEQIGYVPQYFQFDASFPVIVMDVVLMGRLRGGAKIGPYGAQDRKAAKKALEEVGLADVWGRPFADLSGGQRQRVLIARALATQPKLLLLDEPTANVDAAVESTLARLLGSLNERMTIVMVTHDIGFVSANVRSVLCVNRNVAEHPTEDVCGETISRLYGEQMRMVKHDRDTSGDKECLNS